MKTFILLFLIFISIEADENNNFSFLILSQNSNYNFKLADDLRADICKQSSVLGNECPPIFSTHIDFSHVGDWTVIPILSDIYSAIETFSWLIILEERSVIKLDLLDKILAKFDQTKELWVGHALEDDSPTIIHHFSDLRLKYPHMGAGVAITIPLLKRLSFVKKTAEFSIDKSFELALFIWNEANKTSLIHNDAFCTKNEKTGQCASFPKKFETCESPVSIETIYFTVKTCLKFHSERVPVVLSTWARYTKKLDFVSDYEDKSIPTISLGIPNTESGHCGKTIGIFKYLNEKFKRDSSIKWLVIADDDTILSVHRITELLSCYDSDVDFAIGEMYGYNVYNPLGFNYITGGGGMVFSRTLVSKLAKTCRCPSISSPDDMILGHCLANLEINITHSHLFHQARPMDYSRKLLESDRHISFHKHWMLDPIKVYQEWFEKEDSKLADRHIKTEL